MPQASLKALALQQTQEEQRLATVHSEAEIAANVHSLERARIEAERARAGARIAALRADITAAGERLEEAGSLFQQVVADAAHLQHLEQRVLVMCVCLCVCVCVSVCLCVSVCR